MRQRPRQIRARLTVDPPPALSSAIGSSVSHPRAWIAPWCSWQELAGIFGEWVGAEVGVRAHRIIAGLAASGVRPGPADVLAAVLSDLDASPVVERVRRRAVLQTCVGAVNVYIGRAWPAGPWLFEGAEVDLGPARADLVWRHGDTQAILVDELKTGAVSASDLEDQCARLLAGATAAYGCHLLGVRVVPLAAPTRARLHRPDGTVAAAGPRDLPSAVQR